MQKDRLCRSTLRNRARGFTLVELILVIVILGVLAVFAAPRILNTDDFKARGFHDETLSLLRYAQKTAVAQRRSVCVNLNATGVTMTIFATNPATGTCPTPTALNPPNTPRGGTGLAATVNTTSDCAASPTAITAFQYTPLGSTDQLCNLNITIANSTGITVEAATGFVHD
jgi:MSHA pilin protein MshC